MSSEEVNEVKNEEATEKIANVINEEATKETNNEENNEEINEEINEEVSQPKEEKIPIAKAKPKAVPKKLARSVKVVELVECSACNKKMLPKSLRNTHPYYCKGQPTETLPVNRQKASYGSKVEQKLRKEIEDEMRKKYEVVTYSEPIEVKTKQRPVRMEEPSREVSRGFAERQPTATELLQQSNNEMKRLRQQEKQERLTNLKQVCFNYC